MITTQTRFRSHAKHPQVTRELRDRIVQGYYRLGEQLPHRSDLEVELGASRVTMQIALNTLFEQGFIFSTLGKGTFISEHPPFVTNLAIAFPIAAESFGVHRFYAALLAEAQKWTKARGGRLYSYYDIQKPASASHATLLEDAECHRFMGIIWASVPYELKNSPLLNDPHMPPSVAIQAVSDRAFAGGCVHPDLPAFYKQAMKQLADQGRRRVAVIGCDPALSTQKFAVDCARSVGLQSDPLLVQTVPPQWPQLCRRVLPLMFTQMEDSKIDALVISDDNLVSDTTAAVLEMGLRVPEDVMIIAHGNLPQLPHHHVPCDFLAFDAAAVIHTATQGLILHRQGKTATPSTLIAPVLIHDSSSVS